MSIVFQTTKFVMEKARNRRVLYIGVGDEQGRISNGARAVKEVAQSLFGIEIDPKVVRDNPDWNIQLLDLNLPIDAKLPDVDLVIMTEVIEHLQSPIFSLRNIGRLLPGVSILGSVPNALSFGRIISAAWSQRLYHIQDGNHVMLFNELTLRNTLTLAGLKDVRIRPYDTRKMMRPFVALRPAFSQGLIFEGTLSK